MPLALSAPRSIEVVPASPRELPAAAPLREEIAKLPALKRLTALADFDELPGAAHHLLAAVRELTAEDFRALQSGKEKMPRFDRDSAMGAAFIQSLVERWMAVDEAGALAGLPNFWGKVMGDGGFDFAPLLLAVIDARPKEALRVFLAHPPDNAVDAVHYAFFRIAAHEPLLARNFLAECRNDAQRKSAEIGIAAGIAENDPSSGAALAIQLHSSGIYEVALAAAERIGPGAILDVVSKGTRDLLEPSTRNRLIVQYPDAEWETLPAEAPDPERSGVSMTVSELARGLAPEKRLKLLTRTAKFPESTRMELQGALLQAWCFDAPHDAMRWALENHADAGALEFAFRNWARTDTANATAWWQSLPPGATQESLSDAAQAAQSESGKTPDFEQLADTQMNKGADLDSTMRRWVSVDADAAVRWAQSLTDTAQRDRAYAGLAGAAGEKMQLATALDWVDAIAAPRAREAAAGEVFNIMWDHNHIAAREWISGLENTHPLWKQWMLREKE